MIERERERERERQRGLVGFYPHSALLPLHSLCNPSQNSSSFNHLCVSCEMCLRMWESMHLRRRPVRRPPRRAAAADESLEATSCMFSSKDPSSRSGSTTSGSIAGQLAKNTVLPGPLLYKYSEIAAATLDFAASQQIGSSSWKGTIRDSSVAVIRKPGVAKNFHKLLKGVFALHHSNLAQMKGICRTADCIFVVYEFVDGINLQACLSNPLVPGYTVLSTWRLRMQVALDVAKGLEYVHNHSILHAAHKYLTSSSVLLTKETLRAKLALVGIAVLTGEVVATEVIPHTEALSPTMPNEEIDACELQDGYVLNRKKTLNFTESIKIKGTHGYMPPEYLNCGTVSQKYDVFSYGTVLLELLKGKGVGAQTGGGDISIVEEVRSLMENTNGMRGRLRLWMDSRLKDSYPVEDAVKVVFLALSCVSDNPQERPQMSKVVLKMAMFLKSAEMWESERSTMTGTASLQGR